MDQPYQGSYDATVDQSNGVTHVFVGGVGAQIDVVWNEGNEDEATALIANLTDIVVDLFRSRDDGTARFEEPTGHVGDYFPEEWAT